VTIKERYVSKAAASIFFQKGGGTPNLFTVSLMPFFRDFISKACSFCKLLQDISKKHLRFFTFCIE
jgi:hypothetical protein